jgi:mRNA interferase HigB
LTSDSQNANFVLSAVHIISRKKLLEAAKQFQDVAGPLDAWSRVAKSASWGAIEEVRKTYSHADGVKVGSSVYTVFNIRGNKYRLITEIFYKDQTVLVRHVLTHEEYNEEGWKKK